MDAKAATSADLTRTLCSYSRTSSVDLAELSESCYRELKCLADARFRALAPGATLEASTLMDELAIRLFNEAGKAPPNRLQARAAGARLMRRILAEHAQSNSLGQTTATCRVHLFKAKIAEPHELKDILALHHLLDRLAGQDVRMASVVELRYFGGMTNGEVAETLGLAEQTVKREWQLARAWLYSRLRKRKSHAG